MLSGDSNLIGSARITDGIHAVRQPQPSWPRGERKFGWFRINPARDVHSLPTGETLTQVKLTAGGTTASAPKNLRGAAPPFGIAAILSTEQKLNTRHERFDPVWFYNTWT